MDQAYPSAGISAESGPNTLQTRTLDAAANEPGLPTAWISAEDISTETAFDRPDVWSKQISGSTVDLLLVLTVDRRR
jgi:hypothetical protein